MRVSPASSIHACACAPPRAINVCVLNARLPPGHPLQIRIPVSTKEAGAKLSITPLCPPERHGHCLHDATINPRRVGRPYRFVFGGCVVGPRPCNSINGVCRVDVTDGTVALWCESPAVIPAGPPTFLPRPVRGHGRLSLPELQVQRK